MRIRTEARLRFELLQTRSPSMCRIWEACWCRSICGTARHGGRLEGSAMASTGRRRLSAGTCMPRHRGQVSSPSPDDTRRTRRSMKTRLSAHSTIEGRSLAVLLWCSCALAAACGGQSATQPDSSAVVPLTAGQQLLTLGGFSVSFDPTFPTCTPPGQPRDGTSVNTVVALTREGGEWVARSAPGMGSVELRLRGTGKSVRGYVVSGTVSWKRARHGAHGCRP